jgi:hypothetical protein
MVSGLARVAENLKPTPAGQSFGGVFLRVSLTPASTVLGRFIGVSDKSLRGV